MKTKILEANRVIITGVALLLNLSVFAQLKLPSGLIPFKKGKKWGIADTALRIWHPAVFDSVLLDNNDFKGYRIFSRYGNKVYARVIHQGKARYLTPDKKLLPARFAVPGKGKNNAQPPMLLEEGEGELMQEIMLAEGPPMQPGVIVDSFQSLTGRKIKIRKESFGEYRFIEKDTVVNTGTVYGYVPVRASTGLFCIIIGRGQKTGLYSFETNAFLIPPRDYGFLEWLGDKAITLVAFNDPHYRLVDMNGRLLLPQSYTRLDQIPETRETNPVMIAGDKSGEKLIGVINGRVWVSPNYYDELRGQRVGNSNDVLIYTRLKGKTGLINLADSVLLPPEYQKLREINSYGGHFFAFQEENSGKWGFYNAETGVKTRAVYDFFSFNFLQMNFKVRNRPYQIGLASRNGKTIVVDCLGREIVFE